MILLNERELEEVAGGIPFIALPAVIGVIKPPVPLPSDEPVPTETPDTAD